MTNNDIVQKLWNLCDVLRDDGINYSDYVTELVLLLFIKMEFENTEAGLLNKHKLPEGCRWGDLNAKSGTNLSNATVSGQPQIYLRYNGRSWRSYSDFEGVFIKQLLKKRSI
ncbi:MAG: type I restriction-modification system subunit M N-terminal domain-containing protein [Marinagarivorans sp.]|nr:type I restriction-modification system subunit M N-terminal domain-containing protein [Marinagarivorans sp.]